MLGVPRKLVKYVVHLFKRGTNLKTISLLTSPNSNQPFLVARNFWG
jgi:hypothetical protein